MSEVFGKKVQFGVPSSGKVFLYHVETGEEIERWPVDARGMIGCGEYTLTPPAITGGAEEAVTSEPETQDEPTKTPRLHPLSTEGNPVLLKTGEASEAKPIEVPTAGKKRVGKPRKFPKK